MRNASKLSRGGEMDLPQNGGESGG
jgi:hypothetical protein